MSYRSRRNQPRQISSDDEHSLRQSSLPQKTSMRRKEERSTIRDSRAKTRIELNPSDVDSASSHGSQKSKQTKSRTATSAQRNNHRQGNRSKEVRSSSPHKKIVAGNGGYPSNDDGNKRPIRKPNRDISRRHSNAYRRDDKKRRRNNQSRRRDRDSSTRDPDSTSSESGTSSERRR